MNARCAFHLITPRVDSFRRWRTASAGSERLKTLRALCRRGQPGFGSQVLSSKLRAIHLYNLNETYLEFRFRGRGVERSLDKLDGVNCRSNLSAKLVDRFFH